MDEKKDKKQPALIVEHEPMSKEKFAAIRRIWIEWFALRIALEVMRRRGHLVKPAADIEPEEDELENE